MKTHVARGVGFVMATGQYRTILHNYAPASNQLLSKTNSLLIAIQYAYSNLPNTVFVCNSFRRLPLSYTSNALLNGMAVCLIQTACMKIMVYMAMRRSPHRSFRDP
jgi:hypothetical protein